MNKYLVMTVTLIILAMLIGCETGPPRTVEDGETRLSSLVDDYIAECGTITPFGTEKYEDTEKNLKSAKINEAYLARTQTLAKEIEAIEAGEGEGDALKELFYYAGLFLYVLETRAEAFDMIDESLLDFEKILMSARFAVAIELANDKMTEVQAYCD